MAFGKHGIRLRAARYTPAVVDPPPPEGGTPWDLDTYPEMLIRRWDAASLPDGAVAEHFSTGWDTEDLVQGTAGNRPSKSTGAVTFTAGTARSLTAPNHRHAYSIYRWGMMIFRVTGSSGSTDGQLLKINEALTADGYGLPMVTYKRATDRMEVSYRTSSGAVVVSPTDTVNDDGTTLNVLLWFRRNGRLHVSLNGQAETLSTEATTVIGIPPVPSQVMRIGSNTTTSPTWGYDLITLGQSELSDAWARKIEGWAMWRIGRQASLPGGHPYLSAAPIVDADDAPHRYAWTDASEAIWEASEAWAAVNRYAERGNPMPAESDYVLVFHDDFRADSVGRSDNHTKHQHIWYANGFNAGLVALEPDHASDNYGVASNTLSLKLRYVGGSWVGSVVYSIDDLGHGRHWKGPRVIECEAMMPSAQFAVGLFPAWLWSYNPEHRWWATWERIELDGMEFAGDEDFLNGLTSFSHAAEHYPGRFGHRALDVHQELAPTTLVDMWASTYHQWRVDFREDYTYIALNGNEVARQPTLTEHLERACLIFDLDKQSTPSLDTAVVYELNIRNIKVRQPRSLIESFAAPFTARPSLSGTTSSGSTLTCDPKLSASLPHRDFFWYRDAYPIMGQYGPTYLLAAADVGKKIRCMVKAVSATDQPEAWTDETATVT